MKRPRSDKYYFLTIDQRTFLEKVINENFKLSKREHYVVNFVLNNGTYHDNYQYHLNNVGKRYKKSKK